MVVSIFSILPTLLVSILSILPTLLVGILSILSTLLVGILSICQLCLQVSILLTLVVSARAATGWLVGSCRPHVAADGTKTTFFENLNLNLYGSLDLKW